jgi:hypothetical protein
MWREIRKPRTKSKSAVRVLTGTSLVKETRNKVKEDLSNLHWLHIFSYPHQNPCPTPLSLPFHSVGVSFRDGESVVF